MHAVTAPGAVAAFFLRVFSVWESSQTFRFTRERSIMLKVILADDEKKVIFLLQRLIDWEQMGYEIAGIAHDGLSALRLIEETHCSRHCTASSSAATGNLNTLRKPLNTVWRIIFSSP